jgi:molybdenum cofactor biosynthesis enzyme MoaA
MAQIIIPIANQKAYYSIPRNRALGHVIHHHCDKPARSLVIDWKGDCFICSCEAWLPIPVGHIMQFERLEDIWLSPVAQQLQATITDRTYAECAVDRCGILDGDILQDYYTVSINIDESCNLSCASCRSEPIMLSSGPDYEDKLAWSRHIVRLLTASDLPMKIIMSGNGDPLASSIMRPIVHEFEPKLNQTVRLYTNGLLLEKQLTDNIMIGNITEYFISVDAGSPDIYEQVRRGGSWPHLMRNFDFLQPVAERLGAHVLLLFVLQQANYQDMENFILLCIRYGFRGWINRVEDWGTWGSDFAAHDVIGNTAHELHEPTVENLRSVYQRYAGTQIRFESSLERLAKDKSPIA